MARPNQSQDSGAVSFLNPETAISGLEANFEATILSAVWEQWDFKGKAKAKPDGKSGVVMALHVVLGDRDDGGKEHDEYYPAGAIEDFVPNDDGSAFEAVKGSKGFFRDREVIQFSAAVLETGAVRPSDLGMDPSIFEGLRFFWERKPPTWAKDGKDFTGKETKASVLVPTKAIATKGGKGAGKPAATAGKAASKPAAANDDTAGEGGDSDMTALAVKLAKETLDGFDDKEQADGVGRETLASEVLGTMLSKYGKKAGANAIDKDTRTVIGELVADEEFWAENAGKKTWKYNAKSGEVTAV